MHRILLAALSVLTMLAFDAYAIEPNSARLLLRNPEVFYSTPTTPDLRVIRITDKTTDQDRMAVWEDGTVVFAPGATVNFSGIRFRAGDVRGFVVVRVMGRPMLVPVFDLAPGDKLESEWGQP